MMMEHNNQLFVAESEGFSISVFAIPSGVFQRQINGFGKKEVVIGMALVGERLFVSSWSSPNHNLHCFNVHDGTPIEMEQPCGKGVLGHPGMIVLSRRDGRLYVANEQPGPGPGQGVVALDTQRLECHHVSPAHLNFVKPFGLAFNADHSVLFVSDSSRSTICVLAHRPEQLAPQPQCLQSALQRLPQPVPTNSRSQKPQEPQKSQETTTDNNALHHANIATQNTGDCQTPTNWQRLSKFGCRRIGSNGAPGTLNQPSYLWFDSSSSLLYIADARNDRIQVATYDSTTHTLAYQQHFGSTQIEPLVNVGGFCLMSYGELLVSSTNNHKILRFGPV